MLENWTFKVSCQKSPSLKQQLFLSTTLQEYTCEMANTEITTRMH